MRGVLHWPTPIPYAGIMTKLPSTCGAAIDELIDASPMSNSDYRESVRSLCVAPGEQCDLLDGIGADAGPWMKVLLSEALECIDNVQAQLQAESHHSMSLGKAYCRCLQKVQELEAELEFRTTNGYEHSESHFAESEKRRDALLRVASSAASEVRAISQDRLRIEVCHGGEWGCDIRITPDALPETGNALITIEPAQDGSLSVTGRYLSNDRGVCGRLGTQLIQRIFSSLDMTQLLASEHD